MKRLPMEIEKLREGCIPGRAGLSRKEKDEAGSKKTELGAGRERDRVG